MSKAHAAVVHNGTAWLVEDRGSDNGRHLNGVRLDDGRGGWRTATGSRWAAPS